MYVDLVRDVRLDDEGNFLSLFDFNALRPRDLAVRDCDLRARDLIGRIVFAAAGSKDDEQHKRGDDCRRQQRDLEAGSHGREARVARSRPWPRRGP